MKTIGLLIFAQFWERESHYCLIDGAIGPDTYTQMSSTRFFCDLIDLIDLSGCRSRTPPRKNYSCT